MAGIGNMATQNNHDGHLTNPGSILRRLRRERGWPLAELSKRTGLPMSTLSKVETGKMSLTYDKLKRISDGLEVDITQIFGEAKGNSAAVRKSSVVGRRSITRRGEGGILDTPTYNHCYQATDLLNKAFVPIIAEIKHRSIDQFEELIRHEGEEYSYVLEGKVEFHSDLYAPALLHPGDSVYFDSSMGHAYIAVGEGPCRVLSICAGIGMHESEMKARNAAVLLARNDGAAPAPPRRKARAADKAERSRKRKR